VLVQRNAVVDPDAANRLADHCDRRGIRKLFEIDDDLFSLPESHPERVVYEQQMHGARTFLGRADSVIVTTEVLADRMRASNPSVVVIPNNLDDRLWFSGGRGKPRPRKLGEKLRVAFVGGATHKEDLDLIAPALREVMRRRPGAVEFNMIGATFSDSRGLSAVLRLPPSEVAGRYVRFVDWLRRSADWHVGIAPLVASEFNASKSPLKFLDYGALGLAGIYSDGPPFEGVVEPGVTGLLAADGPAWTDALIRLIDHEDFRYGIASAARAEVRKHHTLRSNAVELRQIWLNLLG
jgi:glycosyltransferase involved in cell wall biosynthesis